MVTITDLIPMYAGVNGSPVTTITSEFDPQTTTSLTLADGTILPDAPNICTLYVPANNISTFAVIKYGSKLGNTLLDLSIDYIGGSSIVFPIGSFCSRKYTEYDHITFIQNITNLHQIITTMAQIIVPSIISFSIPDLPVSVPVGTSYIGEHNFLHEETYIPFIVGQLQLLENETVLGTYDPSNVLTQNTFSSSLVFEEVGIYTYTLTGTDYMNNVFSKTQTINVVVPLYIGHLNSETIDNAQFETLTACNDCYDGIEVETASNNDYVWICLAQPYTLHTVSSYGFTVPMQPATTLTIQHENFTTIVNCYRTTALITESANNVFKLTIQGLP